MVGDGIGAADQFGAPGFVCFSQTLLECSNRRQGRKCGPPQGGDRLEAAQACNQFFLRYRRRPSPYLHLARSPSGDRRRVSRGRSCPSAQPDPLPEGETLS